MNTQRGNVRFCDHLDVADLGFGGEVAQLYRRYRRGYPTEILETVARVCALTIQDVVVDLGCGTGQLALPIASYVNGVIAVDPEADMLAQGRIAAAEQGITNVSWTLGSDADIELIGQLAGSRHIAAVTIGQAMHWMDAEQLIPRAANLLRPGGAILLLSNGTPLWLQDSDWSRALRRFLEDWFDSTSGNACGTDDASRERYRQLLIRAGLTVQEASVEAVDALDIDTLIGGLLSAVPLKRLPGGKQREQFVAELRHALPAQNVFPERVPVHLLCGILRQ